MFYYIMENTKQNNKVDNVKKEATVINSVIKKELETKKYSVKFGMNYDKESVDEIFVTVTISNDLKELLDEVIVKKLALIDYTYRKYKGKRYRCKTWLYNSLYDEVRDILLDKKLVDTKILELNFSNITLAEELVTKVKTITQDIIKKIMQYKDFGEEVTYTVTR